MTWKTSPAEPAEGGPAAIQEAPFRNSSFSGDKASLSVSLLLLPKHHVRKKKNRAAAPVRQTDNSCGQAAPRRRAEPRHLCLHRVLQVSLRGLLWRGGCGGGERDSEPLLSLVPMQRQGRGGHVGRRLENEGPALPSRTTPPAAPPPLLAGALGLPRAGRRPWRPAAVGAARMRCGGRRLRPRRRPGGASVPGGLSYTARPHVYP